MSCDSEIVSVALGSPIERCENLLKRAECVIEDSSVEERVKSFYRVLKINAIDKINVLLLEQK